MLNFTNDYSKGVHPQIIKALEKYNEALFSGYGADELSASATEKIRRLCACPQVTVNQTYYFL